MDAPTIDQLATVDPTSPSPEVGRTLANMQAEGRWSPLLNTARDRFLAKYIMTNFGWVIARRLANHGKPFPMPMMGRDTWVYKAYLLHKNPWKYYDRAIAEAYYLAEAPHNVPELGSRLKAMLLSMHPSMNPRDHIARVSAETGIPYDVIEAFEVLWYNVVDRWGDAMYLAHEVYPETRIVEMDENYLKNSAHSDLLKRIGYNHRRMDMTTYMSGIGDHTFLRKMAASDNREQELTKFMMGHGLLLAHTNLLSQRSPGLSRASHLLVASRQGGAGTEEPTLSGISSVFSEAYKRATAQSDEFLMAQLEREAGMRIEDGEVIEVG